ARASRCPPPRIVFVVRRLPSALQIERRESGAIRSADWIRSDTPAEERDIGVGPRRPRRHLMRCSGDPPSLRGPHTADHRACKRDGKQHHPHSSPTHGRWGGARYGKRARNAASFASTWSLSSPGLVLFGSSNGPKIAARPASTTSSPSLRPPQPFASAHETHPAVPGSVAVWTISSSGSNTAARVFCTVAFRPATFATKALSSAEI